jgi:hypothetical protein
VIHGTRIVSVVLTGPAPGGAEVIEGAGKTLLPGLWDMHAYVQSNDGLLNLAAVQLAQAGAGHADRQGGAPKGPRVSGHIPAGLTAAEAVKLGYDEIQHVNFLTLNFMPDVKETRVPARFLEPAKRAADLDLKSPAVREFIQLLRDRHVTLDPTLSVFESIFVDRPGSLAVGFRAVANRLPVQCSAGCTPPASASPAS